MKNARAKRAKLLFFIVNYANLWGFCCRRRRGCLRLLNRRPATWNLFALYNKDLKYTEKKPFYFNFDTLPDTKKKTLRRDLLSIPNEAT